MDYCGGFYGILTGLTKPTDHPSTFRVCPELASELELVYKLVYR